MVRTDVTKRKEAELAIRESEKLFRTVMIYLPVGVSIKDPQGRYQFTNDLYKNWYGLGLNNLQGRHPNEALSDTSQTRIARQQQHDEVLQHGKVVSREDEKLTVSGKAHQVFITKFPIADQSGGIISVGSISTDITEIKQVEVDLRAAKEGAERDSKVKTQFLAAMSHYLRTPLNAVIGFAEVMKDEIFGRLGTAKYREYAQDIHLPAKNLLALVSDILDVSRIEAGEMEVSFSAIDLQQTLNECFRLFQSDEETTGCSLASEIDANLPQLHADELRLKQILVNLVSNSFKFTPAGGAIAVRAYLAPHGGIEISVTDTGIGIRSRYIIRIMEPFVQASDIMSRPHEGNGLGLHLVKSLMALHGGTVAIQSEFGKGTTVTATFPPSCTIQPIAVERSA